MPGTGSGPGSGHRRGDYIQTEFILGPTVAGHQFIIPADTDTDTGDTPVSCMFLHMSTKRTFIFIEATIIINFYYTISSFFLGVKRLGSG